MANKYAAALVATAITIVGAVAEVSTFSWATTLQLAILTVTTFSTYFLPLASGRWQGRLKTGAEVLGALFVALIPLVPYLRTGHVSGPQVALVILAALKALGTELGVAARVAADVLPEQPLPVQTPAV